MGLSEDSYFIFHNPRIVRGRLSAGVEQALHAQNSRESWKVKERYVVASLAAFVCRRKGGNM